MLTISFPGHPKARAILVDEPVNGVSGIVECDICDWHMVLTVSGTEEISDEIEKFIKNHDCLPLARREEVTAFAEKLKKDMPEGRVRVMKGQKLIREF